MEFKNSDQSFSPEVSEGIEKVEWVELDKAISNVGYKNLIPVLEDFQLKIKA